ncbi:S8 family serine peptidase [Candidatus Binatia bacterium]|nr:S8 family serine peptidase [Candidatus Binatia bacterium]
MPSRHASVRIRQRSCFIRVLAVAGLTTLCAAPSPVRAATPERTERVEITLDAAKLPGADRARLADRAQSISDAIASGIPLWRSFDPREVLHDTLATLAREGADVGATAIVNFDLLEVDVPASKRARLERLGFVRKVEQPGFMTPSGMLDSEGLEAIGSDIANTAGLTGTGIKVAVIDSEWQSLDDTIAAGDLPAIPVNLQFKVQSNGAKITSGASINALGDREHGTAAAEVVHEVAPGATLLAYRLAYDNGAVTPAAIKAAIRHAADQGAKVILAPVHFIGTMSDPKGLAAGGTNKFTDDIDYAKAAGATVVVPAGNEALRHYADTFTPCTDCNKSSICNTANTDQIYHAWDNDLPLNDLVLDTDYDDFAYNDGETFNPVRVTCYSATDAVTPSNFKMQLIRFRDLYSAVDPPDFPSCPRDAGATIVDGTEVTLGSSFTKDITPYGGDPNGNSQFDDYYFLAVKRTAGTETPKFRIDCTIAVGELTYFNDASSLSDLAVVSSAVSVAGTVLPAFDTVSDVSSKGPSGDPNGPIKPDVSGPSEVTNFAATNQGFTFWETFNGTSAAASHVAGVVALIQGDRQAKGLPLYTVDEMKQVLNGSAIDLDDGLPSLVGPDSTYGYGLVQVPSAILPGVPDAKTPFDRDGDLKADPATYNPSTATWTWLGSTAGQSSLTSIGGASLLGVSGDFDGDGKADAAIYDPSNGGWTFNTSSTPVAAVIGLGGPDFKPAVGDYDGDGKTDPGVYNPTTGDWKWKGSTSGDGQQLGFGGPTRRGVPADFDGDGKTDVATFEPTTGKWQYIGSHVGAQQFTFSTGKRWIAAPADFDGDGRADAATFQKKQGKWRMRLSSLGGLVTTVTSVGGANWIPVPADYDGDGKADPAAYRKATGLWRYLGSADNVKYNVPAFGGPAFAPVVAQRP